MLEDILRRRLLFDKHELEVVYDAVYDGMLSDEGDDLHRPAAIGRIPTVSLLCHLFALFHTNNANGENGTNRPLFA